MKYTYVLLILFNLFYTISLVPKTPKEILAEMSDEEKAAACIIVAAVSNEEKNQELMERWKAWANYRLDKAYIEDLIKKKIGGIIFYGGNTTPQEQKELTDHYQSLSKDRLIIALDIENSLRNRLDKKCVVNFPCAMTLGAIQDKKLLKKLGYQLGMQLKQLGVHWTYGPVADVNTCEQNPIIGYRSFGSDAQKVSESALAIMQGLQAAGIYACAKHFPGHGDSEIDSHLGQPKIYHDVARLYCVELKPFRAMIEAGVKSIMTAHLEVQALEPEKGKPSSLSHNIVTKLLKQTMKFKGLVVTDALGMKGASNWAPEGELEVQALKAGNDILLCPVNPVAAIKAIVEAVKSGRISQKELDEKVLKILKAKKQMFRHEQQTAQDLEKSLQSKEARALKKELYASAVTLAKSKKDNPFEKLNGKEAVLVISNDEKNVFESTIKTKNVTSAHFPYDVSQEALTIFADTVKKGHDHFIITLHDMNWNIEENYNIQPHIFAFIDHLKKMGKQVTVVLFGSPYSVSQFKNADNIVVAYENDEDAQEAAAHVVCGVRKATGILPVNPNQ